VDRNHPSLSIACQCRLLGISRSGLYYQPKGIDEEDLELMKLIDRQYLVTPFYGARKMGVWLLSQDKRVSRKRVRRLMCLMGLKAIYRRPRTSRPAPGHKVYPYLLGGLKITRPNQVWAADITYIPMARGFLYLAAIIDWNTRYVMGWKLSNTLDADFCIQALEEALKQGRPEIFNTDQGAQFTSEAFTCVLERYGIRVSMDGKGSYNDNLFIERLWRTLKYEEVYLKAYHDGKEARASLRDYFHFYNVERPHQALGYRTPAQAFSLSPLEVHDNDLTADQGVTSTLTEYIPRARAIKGKSVALAARALDCPSSSESLVGKVEAKAELQPGKEAATFSNAIQLYNRDMLESDHNNHQQELAGPDLNRAPILS
jgi:putative transposase